MAEYQIEGTIGAALYEDGRQYLGIADITMPDIEYATFTHSGLGACGQADYSIKAQFKPMKMTVNFTDNASACRTLAQQRMHNLTLNVCKQSHDYSDQQLHTVDEKYMVVCEPIKKTGGSIAPASPQNQSIEFSVFAIKHIVDGNTALHIDVMNYIFEQDGVDYAADIRKALGMAS